MFQRLAFHAVVAEVEVNDCACTPVTETSARMKAVRKGFWEDGNCAFMDGAG